MSKQENIHMVYTIQVRAKATQQFNKAATDDMVDSIGDTLKNWFPKGNVEVRKHDVTKGDKRVVITNVLPVRGHRAAPNKKPNETLPPTSPSGGQPEAPTQSVKAAWIRVPTDGDSFSYQKDENDIVTDIVGNATHAEEAGFKIGEKVPNE